MRKIQIDELVALGGNPSDSIWEWFLRRGLHGPGFTWSQTRREPPGYVGVEHLHEIVEEMSDIDPEFPVRAKSIVTMALASDNFEILRRAIQVAAVIGGEDELRAVSRFKDHHDSAVSADARASAFHLKSRLKESGY